VIDGTAAATIVQNPTLQSGLTNADSAEPSDEDDPVQRLRGLIDDRREEAIQVLQSWIDDPDAEPAK